MYNVHFASIFKWILNLSLWLVSNFLDFLLATVSFKSLIQVKSFNFCHDFFFKHVRNFACNNLIIFPIRNPPSKVKSRSKISTTLIIARFHFERLWHSFCYQRWLFCRMFPFAKKKKQFYYIPRQANQCFFPFASLTAFIVWSKVVSDKSA